jgi:hypothetical protein
MSASVVDLAARRQGRNLGRARRLADARMQLEMVGSWLRLAAMRLEPGDAPEVMELLDSTGALVTSVLARVKALHAKALGAGQ